MFEWFPIENQNCHEQKICQNKKRQTDDSPGGRNSTKNWKQTLPIWHLLLEQFLLLGKKNTIFHENTTHPRAPPKAIPPFANYERNPGKSSVGKGCSGCVPKVWWNNLRHLKQPPSFVNSNRIGNDTPNTSRWVFWHLTHWKFLQKTLVGLVTHAHQTWSILTENFGTKCLQYLKTPPPRHGYLATAQKFVYQSTVFRIIKFPIINFVVSSVELTTISGEKNNWKTSKNRPHRSRNSPQVTPTWLAW